MDGAMAHDWQQQFSGDSSNGHTPNNQGSMAHARAACCASTGRVMRVKLDNSSSRQSWGEGFRATELITLEPRTLVGRIVAMHRFSLQSMTERNAGFSSSTMNLLSQSALGTPTPRLPLPSTTALLRIVRLKDDRTMRALTTPTKHSSSCGTAFCLADSGAALSCAVLWLRRPPQLSYGCDGPPLADGIG